VGHRHHRTPTAEGKVYCCAIKDLVSNRIVGYAIDERMTAQLGATHCGPRSPAGIVAVHSDRGSRFRARTIRAVLTAASLQGSTGRVASAGDNAAMEYFWALLQKNVLDRRRWRTRDELTMRSCSGSSTPTTAAVGSAPSASSPLSSANWPSPHLRLPLRHDQSQPPSTEAAAVPAPFLPSSSTAVPHLSVSRFRWRRSFGGSPLGTASSSPRDQL
jgi:transposase InsO family protein